MESVALHKQLRMRIVLLMAAASLAVMATAACYADDTQYAPRRMALLIGVSNYDNLPPERDLLGPVNDVRLFRDILLERGFAEGDITILADGVSGARLPTRRAILDAWRRIAVSSRPGDFLLFYFAGHGSQQPVSDPSEPDGLEEIILPIDIGRWDGKTGSVRNAITDNEIAAFLADVTATGTDVWAVFDACHSESLTRSVLNREERLRYLRPDDLGVPTNLVGASGRSGWALREPPAADTSSGRITAFYAAASTEPTPELKLPKGHPERRYHGLFSYSLAMLLRAGRHATYRDLADGLLLDYAGQNRRSPTPRFDGNMEVAALASLPRSPVFWQARRTQTGDYDVLAGITHGLTPGSILELHDASGNALDALLEIESASLFRSVASRTDADGSLPESGLVSLFAPSLDFTLVVCGPETGAVSTQIRTIISDSPRLRPGSPPDCDVRIAVDDDWAWFLGPSAAVDAGAAAAKQVPRVRPGDAAGIRALLERLARVRALLLGLAHTPSGLTNIAVEAVVNGGTDAAMELQPGQVSRLSAGDRLALKVNNGADHAVDVTVLFIDAHYRIHALWPRSGESNRVTPGGEFTWGGTIDTSTTLGREQLLVIAGRASPNSVPMDLRFLAETAPSRRGKPKAPLARFLYEAGFANDVTRGPSAGIGADLLVHVLTWTARQNEISP